MNKTKGFGREKRPNGITGYYQISTGKFRVERVSKPRSHSEKLMGKYNLYN
jgi:hypothetical protein